MESVNKARHRLKQYPVLLGKCSSEARIYANCVLKKDSVNLGDCAEEFNKFKNCLTKTAKELKIRI